MGLVHAECCQPIARPARLASTRITTLPLSFWRPLFFFFWVYVRVRVKERISSPPGHVISQGVAPRARVVTCRGGGHKSRAKVVVAWRRPRAKVTHEGRGGVVAITREGRGGAVATTREGGGWTFVLHKIRQRLCYIASWIGILAPRLGKKNNIAFLYLVFRHLLMCFQIYVQRFEELLYCLMAFVLKN